MIKMSKVNLNTIHIILSYDKKSIIEKAKEIFYSNQDPIVHLDFSKNTNKIQGKLYNIIKNNLDVILTVNPNRPVNMMDCISSLQYKGYTTEVHIVYPKNDLNNSIKNYLNLTYNASKLCQQCRSSVFLHDETIHSDDPLLYSKVVCTTSKDLAFASPGTNLTVNDVKFTIRNAGGIHTLNATTLTNEFAASIEPLYQTPKATKILNAIKPKTSIKTHIIKGLQSLKQNVHHILNLNKPKR